MALNSYVTEDGREMARSQVVQAEAAGLKQDIHMKPILLSQIVIKGELSQEVWV